MEFTAQQIADLLGGEVFGDSSQRVNNIAKIEEGKEGCLSFIGNPKYEKYLYTTGSSVLLVNADLEINGKAHPTLIKVKDARQSFTALLQKISASAHAGLIGISERATIASSAKLGKDVYVGPNVFIGEGAVIGDGVKLYANVTIGAAVEINEGTIIFPAANVYHKCVIGSACIIHAGAVIGSDGFGFAPKEDGSYSKVPQLGNVIIGNNVEVGANTTIDRATMGSTLIANGAKLDNLVQIAHNVSIGENTVIAAQSGIAGSTKIGKQCVVGGQVGFAGHLEIADGSIFNAQTGVSKSIKEAGKSWSGTPARGFRENYRSLAYVNQIPTLKQEIADLKKAIEALKG